MVESLPGKVSRNRANSAATLAPAHAVTQQQTSTHTHRTRTARVPGRTYLFIYLFI
jgi:hypothetical protein